MNPIPYRQHAPSGIKTYTDELDWRAQHVAGNIPVSPGMRRCWSDPSAVQILNRQGQDRVSFIPGLEGLGSVTPSTSTYRIPLYDSLSGLPIRCTPSLKSSDFLSSYALTQAHNGMVQTMIAYAWVYEFLGKPVIIEDVTFALATVAQCNFAPGPIPNYPIDLKSDHIYFMVNNDLVALPTREFILRFSVPANSPRAMREAVLKIAQDSGITDESAIQLIRLAITDKPNTQTVI